MLSFTVLSKHANKILCYVIMKLRCVTLKPYSMTVRYAGYAPCIPDSHPHRMTSTKSHTDTVISPDDGHIVARNM